MANATTENRLLGHYRLLAQIGSGGMGAVYRAYDEHLDRDVAVKVLPSSAAVGKGFDSKAQRALRQEALTLSRLNHPNIAQVYDLDKESDTDFIVMELVPGESLAQRLGDGPLSQDELLSIMTQTLHGLAAAHAQGIIHRDVKPANLQITTDGRVKILDFGLARFERRDGLDVKTASTEMDAGGISGTMAYMSPEQLHGEPCDARSDIWSVGIVLYEMATGRVPFQGKTATAMAGCHPARSRASDQQWHGIGVTGRHHQAVPGERRDAAIPNGRGDVSGCAARDLWYCPSSICTSECRGPEWTHSPDHDPCGCPRSVAEWLADRGLSLVEFETHCGPDDYFGGGIAAGQSFWRPRTGVLLRRDDRRHHQRAFARQFVESHLSHVGDALQKHEPASERDRTRIAG